MVKSLFVALLSIVMLFALMINVFAADDEYYMSDDGDYVYGHYTKSVHWSVTRSIRFLKIYGEGEFSYTRHIERYDEFIDGLEISNGITVLNEGAFKGLSFRKILFSSTLKRIEARAFADCDNLQKLVIPEGVEYVGKGAFEDCDSLTHVYIYSKNIVIDEGAFPDSLNLKSVYFYGDSIEVGADNAEFERLLENSRSEIILPILFSVAVSGLIIFGFFVIRKKANKQK